jgi:hypothetical protein
MTVRHYFRTLRRVTTGDGRIDAVLRALTESIDLREKARLVRQEQEVVRFVVIGDPMPLTQAYLQHEWLALTDLSAAAIHMGAVVVLRNDERGLE